MAHAGRIEQTFTTASTASTETLVVDKSFNLTVQGGFTGGVSLERRPLGSALAFGWGLIRTFVGNFEGFDTQGGESYEFRFRTESNFVGSAMVRLSKATREGGGNVFERQGSVFTATSVVVSNEVEIKNDTGAPIPVSGTVTVSNPTSVETGLAKEATLATRATEVTLNQRNNLFASLLKYEAKTSEKLRRAVNVLNAEAGAPWVGLRSNYHLRAPLGTATSATTWEAVRFRLDALGEDVQTSYLATGVSADSPQSGPWVD